MMQAISAALSGDVPKHIFEAVSEDQGEATAMYERYMAARRLARPDHERDLLGDA